MPRRDRTIGPNKPRTSTAHMPSLCIGRCPRGGTFVTHAQEAAACPTHARSRAHSPHPHIFIWFDAFSEVLQVRAPSSRPSSGSATVSAVRAHQRQRRAPRRYGRLATRSRRRGGRRHHRALAAARSSQQSSRACARCKHLCAGPLGDPGPRWRTCA